MRMTIRITMDNLHKIGSKRTRPRKERRVRRIRRVRRTSRGAALCYAPVGCGAPDPNGKARDNNKRNTCERTKNKVALFKTELSGAAVCNRRLGQSRCAASTSILETIKLGAPTFPRTKPQRAPLVAHIT